MSCTHTRWHVVAHKATISMEDLNYTEVTKEVLYKCLQCSCDKCLSVLAVHYVPFTPDAVIILHCYECIDNDF